MDNVGYYIIYLSSGLLGVYTTYRLLNIFFKVRKSSSLVEVSSYIFFYVFTNFVYLTINIPMVTLLANIICLIILSYNYESAYKNRFIAILLTYIVLMIIETVVTLSTGFLVGSIFKPGQESPPLLGYIFTKLIGFFVVLFMEGYTNIKKGSQISTSYWLSILAISLSSLYIILVILDSNIGSFQVSIIISLLFIVIMIIFYLYDGLKARAEMEIENTLLEQEKKYYMKQFEIMKFSVDNTRSLKHDIRNHLGVIGGLLYNNEKSKALEYINQLGDYTEFSQEYVSTGNLVIDSILNYKLDSVKTIGTKIELNTLVPYDLELQAFDMVVILGNLLDNAKEALNKLDKNKIFSLSIKYELGMLIISSKNTYDGNLSIDNGDIISSKEDRRNHGLGLKNINSVLEKYNGVMKYNYTDDEFMVKILMYMI